MPNKLHHLSSIHSYSNLINQLVNCNRLEQALQPPKSLKKMFFPTTPTEILEKTKNLLDTSNIFEKLTKTEDTLSVANKLHHLSSIHSYSNLINQLVNCNRLEQALQPPKSLKKMFFPTTPTEILEKMKPPLLPLDIIENSIYSQQPVQCGNLIKKDTTFESNDTIGPVVKKVVNKASKYTVKYIPNFRYRVSLALQHLNSEQPENLLFVTVTLRRILEDLAKEFEPTNTSKKYYDILKKYIKGKHSDFYKAHLKFIVNEANEGVHNPVTQNQAEKLFLHFILFLDEINWNVITKEHLN